MSDVILHHQNHYWNRLRRPVHPNIGVCLLLLVLLAPLLSSSAPGLLAMRPCNIPQPHDNTCLGNDAAHNSAIPSTIVLVMIDTFCDHSNDGLHVQVI